MIGETKREGVKSYEQLEALPGQQEKETEASWWRDESTDLWAPRITHWLTLLLHWVSVHWLLMANLAIGTFTGLPILAPVLMETGHERAANLIYLVFRPLCHQLPERSFFLFGERWVYSYQDLSQRLPEGLVPLRYIGARGVGFSIAVCQRDVAIYLMMLVAGFLFAAIRGRLRPLSVKQFLLMIVPMAVDGTGQLVGLWESIWWSRLLTGGLFGLACVWLTYPHIEHGMRELRAETVAALKQWGR